MNTSKILKGGLAGGVALFFAGWIIYGMALKGYMEANFDQSLSRGDDNMIWWSMIGSNLLLGVVLAMIVDWSGSKGFMGAMKTCAIFGLLMGLSMDMMWYSMSTSILNMGAMFVDAIAFMVMVSIGGGVIGLVNGKD